MNLRNSFLDVLFDSFLVSFILTFYPSYNSCIGLGEPAHSIRVIIFEKFVEFVTFNKS